MKSKYEKILKQHISKTIDNECPDIDIKSLIGNADEKSIVKSTFEHTRKIKKHQKKSLKRKLLIRIPAIAASLLIIFVAGNVFLRMRMLNDGPYYMDNCMGMGGNIREEYYDPDLDECEENPIKKTTEEATSTFSIDVDTASYSIIRKFIDKGVKPSKDVVRIEEMLNYFSYNYPQPEDDKPFSVTTEIGRCPWNEKSMVAMIGLKGKEIPKENLPLSNLVFLIDVSGSMETPNKLPLLKSSFKLLVEQLGENDRVSIVVYAGASGVVLEGASGLEKDRIMSAIQSLEARGSTAGAAGINEAYNIAKKYMIPGGNNRVILATDGDFNVGPSSPRKLKKLIEEKRKEGIYLSVLGFGRSLDGDDVMETLADAGNGNYAIIDSINEAKKVLVEEMGGTLFTIAKGVKVQVNFNPDVVSEYRLIGYENRILENEDFKDDSKDAVEMGAGHTVTALYEIVPAKGIDGLNEGDKFFDLALRYKDPDEKTSKEINHSVNYKNLESNSEDFNFATAVAEFGLILRDSQYKGNADIKNVMERALNNMGEDNGGYRKEFLELVKKYEDIDN